MTEEVVGVVFRSIGKPNPIIHQLRKVPNGWRTRCSNTALAEPVDPTATIGRRCGRCASEINAERIRESIHGEL